MFYCRLTWRDAQHLVVRSVRPHTDLAPDAGFRRNAAGRHYSPAFGFGLLDAGAGVAAAKTWREAPAQARCEKLVVGRRKGSRLTVRPERSGVSRGSVRQSECK